MYALILYNLGEKGWFVRNQRAPRWECVDFLGDGPKDCRSRISYLRRQRPNLSILSTGDGTYAAYLYRSGKRYKAWEGIILPISLSDLRLRNRYIDRE